jgi:hypothetical protein
MHTKFWSENLKGKNYLKDRNADRRIILQRSLKIGGGGCGLNSSGTGQELLTESGEHDNEFSGAIKVVIFFNI